MGRKKGKIDYETPSIEEPKEKKFSVKISEDLLDKFEDMLEQMEEDAEMSPEEIAEELQSYKNEIYSFLSTLKEKNKPLKIWDDAAKPTLWTDVIFSEMKDYNWTFSLETRITEENEKEIYNIVSENIPDEFKKDYTKGVYIDSYNKVSEFESFIIDSFLKSDEDIINWTKKWLETYYPEFADLKIVWDTKALNKYMHKLSSMARLVHDDIDKWNFVSFDL